MADTTLLPQSSAATADGKGLAARVIGILTSPRATYSDVAVRPRWFGILVVVLLATVVPVLLLLSTEVGQRAAIDRQIQVFESLGRTVSDAQYQQFERMAPVFGYIAAASQAVGLPFVMLALAGLIFAVFNGGLGGNATFRQIFSVVAHSGVVMAMRAVFSSPLNYARETLTSPTSLAAVFPFFADNTFAARLLGSVDLFFIWWTMNLAIGLGVLYGRRTTPIATAMLVVYGAIALAFAAVMSMVAGA